MIYGNYIWHCTAIIYCILIATLQRGKCPFLGWVQNECLDVSNWVKRGPGFKCIAAVLCIRNVCAGELPVSLCLDGVQQGSEGNIIKPDRR